MFLSNHVALIELWQFNTRWPQEEVGSRHQQMDRRCWQVIEGCGEQGMWRKMVRKSTCGASMTRALKGSMMLMMMQL